MIVFEDYILVEAEKNADNSADYFSLPEDPNVAGKVAFVGPDADKSLLGTVVYFKSEYQNVKIKGKQYKVMRMDNVFGRKES